MVVRAHGWEHLSNSSVSRTKVPKSSDADFRKFLSFTTLRSVYIITGLLVSANSYMSLCWFALLTCFYFLPRRGLTIGLYCLLLAKVHIFHREFSIAVSWQVYTIVVAGLIFKSSSVFSNSITAVGLPIVPVVAVIVFHDKMNASKILSIILPICGFISFVYLDAKRLKTNHTTPVGSLGLSVEEGHSNIQSV